MTDFKVISNTCGNHFEALNKLIQPSTHRLVIASPYLAADLVKLLSRFKLSKLKEVVLVTTLKPANVEQFTKPTQIRSFFEFFSTGFPEINVKLHINNKLHGKLYFCYDFTSSSMIVSSANFTLNGLENNDEWGILIHDKTKVNSTMDELMESVKYRDVTYSQMVRAEKHAAFYARQNPISNDQPKNTSDVLSEVYRDDGSKIETQYFLKPIGTTEQPIRLEDEEDFSALHQPLHFSKKKPASVRRGDFVLTYAVGAGVLISYFKVIGGLQHVTDTEIMNNEWKKRFPWYLEGRNQSENFGSNWWHYKIKIKDILAKFLELNPDSPVTFAGGATLGTLSFGSDKVKITKEFGEFIISEFFSKTLSQSDQ